MKYLVLAFDPQGRRVLTESSETERGITEITMYARTLGAVQALVYFQVQVLELTEVDANESL